MDSATDADLVHHIAGGGAAARDAESELCRRFAPRVRLYGCKHLRDEDRARDLTQAVLVGVIEAARAGRIDDPQRLDRFVLGTCRNSVLRMRQREARTPLASESAVAGLSTLAALPELERIDTGALFGCLAKLELRAKRILMLSFFEERKADEIAGALALSAGNVRVIRHRALAAVRACLDGQETEA